MSSTYPTSIDNFTNPVGTDKVNNANAALVHSTQHSQLNDAVEALEAKVGANSSAVTTSHDYKLSGVTTGDKAVAKSSSNFTGGKVILSSGNNNVIESSLTVNNSGILDIASGGLGVSLTDPNANRLIGWDDATNSNDWVTVGSGLTLTGKTLTATSSNLTTNQTASEDLTIGTPVGISNVSGGVAKAISGSYTKTITPNASTGPTSNCNIGTDKMVTVYVDSGSLKAYVSTVNRSDYANAFTQGTAVTVTATLQVSGLPFSVAKLDTDKFFIVYTETGNTAIARLVIATVSGTTITLGTAVDLYTFGELIETTSSVFVSTDKGFVTITGTTLPTRTIAFTASGTVATIGSSVALNASLVRGNVSSLINTDKIIVIASGYGQVATLSGTTITVGSAVQFDANWNTSTYLSNQDVISHTNDAFIVNYPDTAPSKQMIAATVSGTTITFGSKTAAASTNQTCLYPISSTKILASASNIGYVYTISGTTISNPVFTNSTSPSRRNIINMGTYFIMYEQSTNSITYYIQGMAKGFIGFAQATVSRGATVTVVNNGKDGNQTGLNPGSYYKVSAGALTTIDSNQSIATLNDTVVVKALSSTEITF